MSNKNQIPDHVMLAVCNTLRDTIGLASHVQPFELAKQSLKVQSIVVIKLEQYGFRQRSVEAFARLRKLYPDYCREEKRAQELDRKSGMDDMIEQYKQTGTF